MTRVTSGVVVSVIGAVMICIGSLGPWAEGLGQTVPGTDMDGPYMLALALIALGALWVFAATGKQWPAAVTLLLGIAVAAIGVIDFADINDTTELMRDLSAGEDLLGALEVQANADQLRDPAWGIYLVIAGGIVLAVASAVAWNQKGVALLAERAREADEPGPVSTD